MERKLTRFLIVFSGTIVMLVFALLVGFNIIPDSEMVDFTTAFSVGFFHMFGQMFFFIAYDLIGEGEGFKGVIRGFFLILAWIITVAGSLLVLFVFLGEIEYHLQPWEGAVMAQWITCGLLTYVIYRSIDPEENVIISAFAPYISLVISYFANVLVIYLLSLLASVVKVNALLIILYLLLLVLYCLSVFKNWTIDILSSIIEGIPSYTKINEYKHDIYEETPKPVKKPVRRGLFGEDLNKEDFERGLVKEITSAIYAFERKGGYSGASLKLKTNGYINVRIEQNGSMNVSISNYVFIIEYGYRYKDKDYSSLIESRLESCLSDCITKYAKENRDLYEVTDYELSINIKIESYVDENKRGFYI